MSTDPSDTKKGGETQPMEILPLSINYQDSKVLNKGVLNPSTRTKRHYSMPYLGINTL